MPQDTERTHESAARCGNNVIPGLSGRGVGITFERFGLIRLAALTQADLVRPLNSNVRQLRKGGFRKHQSLIVTTMDQVSGHACSHAATNRYRENNTTTIRIETLRIPSPHFTCNSPTRSCANPHNPRNFSDHNLHPERLTGNCMRHRRGGTTRYQPRRLVPTAQAGIQLSP